MRADGINPRVGMTVAFCIIFLIFGLMFTVSGANGEALGPVPLIALGPAIFIPAVGVIILATKTDGFSTWPRTWPRLPGWGGLCCRGLRGPTTRTKSRLKDLEGLYSIGGSSESGSRSPSLEGPCLTKRPSQIWEEKGGRVLWNLRECCPSSGVMGRQEKLPGLCLGFEHIGVKESMLYIHTNQTFPFKDGFAPWPDALYRFHSYYANPSLGTETVV